MFHTFKTRGADRATMEASRPLGAAMSWTARLTALLLLALPAATCAREPVNVAFALTAGANVIDFAGPWEVFQDTPMPGTEDPGFRLYTVSDSRSPVRMTGGLQVVPDYTFDDAPAPDVVVVGAQSGSPRLQEWLKKVGAAQGTGVVMSVCTGAFKVAQAGLFDGKSATTHHDYFDEFARRYPQVKLVRDARYVEASPRVYSAGGLTSGFDLALHIVARFYGEEAARATARYMEFHPTAR